MAFKQIMTKWCMFSLICHLRFLKNKLKQWFWLDFSPADPTTDVMKSRSALQEVVLLK